MMIILLALGAFAGAVLTFTYATVIYAFSPLEARSASIFATLTTLATFVGLWLLNLSTARQVDAGGLFVQSIFILVAFGFGSPLGVRLFSSSIRRIEAQE